MNLFIVECHNQLALYTKKYILGPYIQNILEYVSA